MPSLPSRRKIVLLLFRRAPEDEILLVERQSKGNLIWSPPATEAAASEDAAEAARRLAGELAGASRVVDLDLASAFRVKEGPNAGEWSEVYFAAEVAPASAPGRWLPHYEAKAACASPKVREAITRLREREKLKP